MRRKYFCKSGMIRTPVPLSIVGHTMPDNCGNAMHTIRQILNLLMLHQLLYHDLSFKYDAARSIALHSRHSLAHSDQDENYA